MGLGNFGGLPRVVAITPDGEFIYVTRASTGNGVTVIETATNTVVDSLPRYQ